MSRIYVVTEKQTGWKHLVDAESQAQAIGVVVDGAYEAKAATSKEVADLMAAGKTVTEAPKRPAKAANVPALALVPPTGTQTADEAAAAAVVAQQ